MLKEQQIEDAVNAYYCARNDKGRWTAETGIQAVAKLLVPAPVALDGDVVQAMCEAYEEVVGTRPHFGDDIRGMTAAAQVLAQRLCGFELDTEEGDLMLNAYRTTTGECRSMLDGLRAAGDALLLHRIYKLSPQPPKERVTVTQGANSLYSFTIQLDQEIVAYVIRSPHGIIEADKLTADAIAEGLRAKIERAK